MPKTETIHQDNPQHQAPVAAHRIKTVQVVGGFMDGLQIQFHDRLNCIIGGRGTGKSTTLELIRYGLDAMPDDPRERKRIESLVEQNLAGGRVQIEVETKDGLSYTITRCWGEEPIVLSADGNPTAISLATSGLFQADIYSQNNVESIADRVASQLALIDNFETETIAEIEAKLRRVESMLASNAGQIMPLQEKLAALGDELNTLPSVDEKLKRFSTNKGEDTGEIDGAHALKALRDREQRATNTAGEMLRTMARSLAELDGQIARRASVLIGPEMAEGPNGAMLQQLVQGILVCGEDVDRLLQQARERIGTEQEALSNTKTALATVHQRQELAFREVIERHQQAQGEAAERAQLERLRNGLMAKQRLRDEMAEQLRAVECDRDELLARLTKLRDQRFAIREEVVERINATLSPTIRVSIVQFGNSRHYVRLLENGLRGAAIKHGVVARRLVSAFWPSELSDIVRRGDTDALIAKGGLSAAQAEKVITTLDGSQTLFDLQTVELMDRPQIELLDGRTYKESMSLSTGQKCTA
ncbi:MAG: AAA family ATPase, partial [Candidatus Nealsonbacteria bacterium]|nr:AAA family ATPase [Candidatus Nealsonbacteria bacterium]